MLKPICVKDHVFYTPKKNGVYITEGYPIGYAARGLDQPDAWKPYKIWQVDLWECPECGNQIYSGSGIHPIRENHHHDFHSMQERLGADQYQVNDC